MKMERVKIYLQQLKQCKNCNPFDVIWCGVKYGASPNNYRDFNFKVLTSAERATYVTNRISRAMFKKFNNPDYIYNFEDKTVFAQRFSAYFNRDWVATDGLSYEKFLEFISKKTRFIMKPVGSAQGMGIVVYDDLTDPACVYEKVIKEKAILEEWIEQHPALSGIYAAAINCLRVITVYQDGKTVFLAGGVTWGNGKKIANASASGIVSPIEFETGKLLLPAGDFDGHVYQKHPITGANLVGIQVPFWKETVQMIELACAEVPQVGYVGWDIAITPTGPIIIEGNTTPGYRYYQIPVHMTHKTGNRVAYEACLKK